MLIESSDNLMTEIIMSSSISTPIPESISMTNNKINYSNGSSNNNNQYKTLSSIARLLITEDRKQKHHQQPFGNKDRSKQDVMAKTMTQEIGKFNEKHIDNDKSMDRIDDDYNYFDKVIEKLFDEQKHLREKPLSRPDLVDSDEIFNEDELVQGHGPTNLFGYKGIWIGNVDPRCRKSTLHVLFSKYGSIKMISVIKESFCAFIAYDNPMSPRRAIHDLYEATIYGICKGGRPLIFRFVPTNHQKQLNYHRPIHPKFTNGECYFWRTTGCKNGDNCKLKHIYICKEIDFQPWMIQNKFSNSRKKNNFQKVR